MDWFLNPGSDPYLSLAVSVIGTLLVYCFHVRFDLYIFFSPHNSICVFTWCLNWIFSFLVSITVIVFKHLKFMLSYESYFSIIYLFTWYKQMQFYESYFPIIVFNHVIKDTLLVSYQIYIVAWKCKNVNLFISHYLQRLATFFPHGFNLVWLSIDFILTNHTFLLNNIVILATMMHYHVQ